MNTWKRFFITVAVYTFYLIGVALIGYGLLKIWKPIAFVFFGLVSVYVGICLFNLLEDMK